MPRFGFLLSFALLLAIPVSSPAHGLAATATLEGGRVHVSCFYDDDEPAADAILRVEDEAKNLVAEGKSDGQGRWSFAAPPPGKYRILVDAGGGHRAKVMVTVPADGGADGVVSQGPSREEFTRFPWMGLGLGVGLLAILGLIVPRLLRRSLSRERLRS